MDLKHQAILHSFKLDLVEALRVAGFEHEARSLVSVRVHPGRRVQCVFKKLRTIGLSIGAQAVESAHSNAALEAVFLYQAAAIAFSEMVEGDDLINHFESIRCRIKAIRAQLEADPPAVLGELKPRPKRVFSVKNHTRRRPLV